MDSINILKLLHGFDFFIIFFAKSFLMPFKNKKIGVPVYSLSDKSSEDIHFNYTVYDFCIIR